MTATIGGLQLGPVPRIAVALFDDDPRGAARAVRGLADCIELRIDGFANLSRAHVSSVIREIRAATGAALPLIATVRAAEEGGRAKLTDAERDELYDAVLPLVDAVDIELRAGQRDRVIARARDHDRASIVSCHDFERTPAAEALEATFNRAHASGATMVKIAAAAKELEDVIRLLEFTLRHRHDDVITIAMGAAGTASRVFFPLAGSRLSYAYHRKPTGPGQLSLRALHRELRRYYPAFGGRRNE